MSQTEVTISYNSPSLPFLEFISVMSIIIYNTSYMSFHLP